MATRAVSPTVTLRLEQQISTVAPTQVASATATVMLPEPTSTSTATPTLVPSFPPDSQIQLLGPPAGARFTAADDVTFYWLWPDTLADNESLLVYIYIGDESRLIGSMNEPNLGDAFRLRFPLGDLEHTTADLSWQVVLATARPEPVGIFELLKSERRPLAISSQP